jgi:hypothetical protein
MLTDAYLSPRNKHQIVDLITNQKQFTPSFKIKLDAKTKEVDVYYYYSIKFSKPEATVWFQESDDHSFYYYHFPFKKVIVSAR